MGNSTQHNDANGGTPLAEPTGSQFDEWLTDQPMWVKCLTNSNIVKEAMKLAFYANAEAHGRAPARTVQPLVGSVNGGTHERD